MGGVLNQLLETSEEKNPTRDAYTELGRAFDFFNNELFDGRLPRCLITLPRQHDTYGYFSANQFVSQAAKDKGELSHEIALNPTYFAVRSIHETLSVLVREMVSLDQLINGEGKRPRRRYRNREWAEMCEAVGLMPTDTGKPGGKRTGDNVQTYIIDGGLFDIASAKLVDDEFKLSWVDRYVDMDPEELSSMHADDESHGHHAGGAMAFSAPPETSGSLDDDLHTFLGDDESSDPLVGTDLLAKPVNPFKSSPEPQAGKSGAGDKEQNAPDAPKMKVYAHTNSADLATLGIEAKQTSKSASKTKYCCPNAKCKANVWGKPNLRVACMGTDKKPHDVETMQPEGAGQAEPADENQFAEDEAFV